MKVQGYGECKTLEKKQYNHTTGKYYAWVRFPDGEEGVVTSRTYAGPFIRSSIIADIHTPHIEGQTK